MSKQPFRRTTCRISKPARSTQISPAELWFTTFEGLSRIVSWPTSKSANPGFRDCKLAVCGKLTIIIRTFQMDKNNTLFLTQTRDSLQKVRIWAFAFTQSPVDEPKPPHLFIAAMPTENSKKTQTHKHSACAFPSPPSSLLPFPFKKITLPPTTTHRQQIEFVDHRGSNTNNNTNNSQPPP